MDGFFFSSGFHCQTKTSETTHKQSSAPLLETRKHEKPGPRQMHIGTQVVSGLRHDLWIEHRSTARAVEGDSNLIGS